MKTPTNLRVITCLFALMLCGRLADIADAKEVPVSLPAPDGKIGTADTPIKVYILSGQSNMVGIGQVNGGGTRWGKEFTEPELSVYEGAYNASVNYDNQTPIKTLKLASFGGTSPTPFPGGGTQIVRGFLETNTTGVYEMRPGYGDSSHCAMEIDGKEVYRKEVGKDAVYSHLKLVAGTKMRFKITYFTDGANGLGWMARIDIPGTLTTVVKQNGKFSNLIDDAGNWSVRKDVWYKGLVSATANKWLSVGCGAGTNNIGPELGIGHVLGYYHDEPVLLIKSSIGNRSLAWDFLPPGSKRYEVDGKVYAGYKDSPASWDKGTTPKKINWYAGKQYDDCFQAVHGVLNNFDSEFPQFKGRKFEVAGFIWWQGHKDGNEVHANRYEQNLVHLINTLRESFNAPKAPVVIGTIGFGGWELAGPHLTVANAQLAISGEKNKYPEYKGNVLTVETRDFWIPAEKSPRNQDYHYNQNAEVYYRIGDALGRGMVKLLEGQQ